MDDCRFNKIVKGQMIRCLELLFKKGIEYDSNSDDRLYSFKRGAVAMDSTPKQVLIGYMNKHIMSIYDMCFDGFRHPIEKWDEKITDAINYLLLLRAMVEEEEVEEYRSEGA